MKILVVLTGGTIGSDVKNGVANVSDKAPKMLLDIFSKRDDIIFESVSPFNLLSENSDCETLARISSFMLSLDFDNYDGVILTHGSDTLAYTSAMLGFVLSWVKIPVVITAADYVLSSPRSNGFDNFNSAIDFILDFANELHQNTGVFTIWKNRGEPVRVYISTRLNEADGYLDKFSSWGGSAFGIMKNSHFIRTESEINPISTKPCKGTEFFKFENLTFDKEILILHSYVGLDFDAVSIKNKSAVLLKLYHSATACDGKDKTSFSKFAQKCISDLTDVYICSSKNSDYRYQSSESISNIGIIPLNNISVISAYCKLVLAYSLKEEKRNFIISENLFYEHL